MKIKCCQTDYGQSDSNKFSWDDVEYEMDLYPLNIWQCLLIIPCCIGFGLWYIITQT